MFFRKNISRIFISFSISFIIVFPGVRAQTPIEITIDAAAIKTPVSPYIYGKNNSLSDKSSKPLSSAEWKKLKDAGITMFRECGGNNSTKYNWKKKLSSHPDWYNNVYSHDWDFAAKSLQNNIPSAQGMWAFQLIGKVAKTNSYNFNDWEYNHSNWWSGVYQNLAGGGTVNTAGGGDALTDGNPDLYLEDWAADSTVKILDHWFSNNQVGLDSTKIRYWGMDNEPEIWFGTHDDIITEQPSAEEFMQMYFDVAKKARAKFPGIKLCGPVPANEWQWYNWKNTSISYKGKKFTWLEYFILRIAEEQKATGIRLLDVLDIHFYPGENKPEDILQLHRVFFDKTYIYPGANGVHRIGGGWNTTINKEYIFERCNEWLTKYIGDNHGVKFGVSETGINSQDPNICANWYASTLGEFAKHGVQFFTPWSWKKGMYEVLHLFSNYAQNFYIAGNSSNEYYVSAYPTINKSSDSMTVFLVNRNITEKKTIQLDVRNFAIGNNPIPFYTISNLPNHETFVSHTQNALKSSEINDSKYFIEIELDPLSVNAIVLQAATVKSSKITEPLFDLKVFPNPSNQKINLNFCLPKTENTNILLLSTGGQKIYELANKKFTEGIHSLEFDVSGIPNGFYYLRMISGEQNETKKLIVQH